MHAVPDRDEPRSDSRVPFPEQRRGLILERLRTEGRADAAAIAQKLGVTSETVRKDLMALEQLGLLRRVHGGAVPVGRLTYEPAVSTRTGLIDEKNRIAKAALRQLPIGGSVLLDAGSTTGRLAAIFPHDKELTVYTNTLSIATSLLDRPLLTLHTLGGRVRPLTEAEVDDWASRSLSEINVDVAFLGANAISIERGLTTPDPAEAAVKRLMLESARRRVLLADHTKFGCVSNCKHADLADIDIIITDSGVDQQELKAVRAAGVEVELA
ncbi:DeoR/GlpR family DNA-binding transcription regulator [Arthrobacter globiformis]|uniref:DeoR/GlpR family DNA-binding transcription regulator n=1 Tax=Arthrobacter globiformis TaxID=1665 RepID=UPI003978CC6D